MNYFAHGVRFLDRPDFLAGTACPDWLSAADRGVRLRSRRVRPFADDDDFRKSQFAAGVLQHLADDDWFHTTQAFYETTGQLARLFKPLGEDDGFRAGFLGHIAMELLLDAVLIDRDPARLDAYYETCDAIDEQRISKFVAEMAPREAKDLPKFIRLFREIQFLRCYTDPPRLLRRINQVLGRVRLAPLSDRAIPVLESGYDIVAESAAALLPADRFGYCSDLGFGN